ncbi:MAG: aspartate carbamoyltransferase catalytic subunit, partial [Rudaea sp.]
MNTSTHELQFDAHGSLRHLITLAGIGRARLDALLDRAEAMRRDSREGTRPLDLLGGRTLI